MLLMYTSVHIIWYQFINVFTMILGKNIASNRWIHSYLFCYMQLTPCIGQSESEQNIDIFVKKKSSRLCLIDF